MLIRQAGSLLGGLPGLSARLTIRQSLEFACCSFPRRRIPAQALPHNLESAAELQAAPATLLGVAYFGLSRVKMCSNIESTPQQLRLQLHLLLQ